jgi:hypothetical protein
MRQCNMQFLTSVASLALLVAATAAPAATITTITTATGTLGADSWVADPANTTVRGAQAVVSVKYVSAKGYIRFDLSGVDVSTITAAQLDVTFALGTTNSLPFEVFGIVDGYAGAGSVLGEDWAETALNGANAPGNTASTSNPTPTASVAPKLGTTVNLIPTTGSTHTLLQGADLVNFLKADTNDYASFIITSNSGSSSNRQFASKETTTEYAPATLVLTVPEPAAIALGTLAIPFLGRRRRSVE